MHGFGEDESAEPCIVRRFSDDDARPVRLAVCGPGDEVFLRDVVEMSEIVCGFQFHQRLIEFAGACDFGRRNSDRRNHRRSSRSGRLLATALTALTLGRRLILASTLTLDGDG